MDFNIIHGNDAAKCSVACNEIEVRGSNRFVMSEFRGILFSTRRLEYCMKSFLTGRGVAAKILLSSPAGRRFTEKGRETLRKERVAPGAWVRRRRHEVAKEFHALPLGSVPHYSSARRFQLLEDVASVAATVHLERTRIGGRSREKR